jgi:hypothetical protein
MKPTQKLLIVIIIGVLLVMSSLGNASNQSRRAVAATGEQAIANSGFSNPPEKKWEKAIGGSGNDYGYSIYKTSDGGYIITGNTFSYGAGGSDVYLIKTDSLGNKVWDKTFGGSDHDYGYSVCQVTDGGYIISGTTGQFNIDVLLIKTDASGNKLWEKTFGGRGNDYGYSTLQASDGGYIIAGTTYSYGAGDSDVWLIKTDASGNKIWDKTFGSSGYDYGFSVCKTSDGGYVIAGAYRTQGWDVWLIKTDASGNKVWEKTFGGSGNNYGRSVLQTSDGGYIITGDKGWNVYLIKTDALGNKVWDKTFSSGSIGYSICQIGDGNYFIAGIKFVSDPDESELFTAKTDASGNTIWIQIDGGADIKDGKGVCSTTDNGCVVVGKIKPADADNFDVYLVQFEDSIPNTCNLTMDVNPPGSGTTVPSEGSHTYVQGTMVDLSAFPNPGWEFDRWSGDITDNATPTQITMDSDKRVTANFELIVTPGDPGDANSDGFINIFDMTKVARIILELDNPTDGADCNGDGSINIFDMTCIARIILELDKSD